MTPTAQDMEMLRWVRGCVEQAVEAVPFMHAVLDRLEAGGSLSGVELEEYETARALIARAREATALWDSWLADR